VNARLSSLALPPLTLLALVVAASSGSSKAAHTIKQTNCQVVWSNRGTAAGRFNLYILDMPQDQWVTGSVTLDNSIAGKERTAIYYDEMDVPNNVYTSRAIATGGNVTLTVSGTAPGDTVTIADAGGHGYFDFDANDHIGTQSGDGGAASFTGVWSSTSTGVTLSPGNGTVAITYKGSAETIGFGNPNAPLEYGICYQFDTNA
jgi:hypothetical protein